MVGAIIQLAEESERVAEMPCRGGAFIVLEFERGVLAKRYDRALVDQLKAMR